MSQFKNLHFQSLSTTSMRMAAVRLKSANKHIFRALLSLASAALLVRMVGMLNQVIVTSRFGVGATMDAYFVASTLPILIAQVIGNAVEASVIPTYAGVRSQGKKEQAIILFSTLLNILIIGSILLTAILLIFSRQMILLSAPGLDPGRASLAAHLSPFIFPVLILMIVIGFLECILNTEGQFGLPAYAGLLVPLTTAILVLTMGASQGVIMLCVGMLVGLCLQLFVFIVRVRRAGLVYRPIINLHIPEIGVILIAAWPVLLGALMSQSSPLVDQIFASSLSTGSISAINYSLKLVSVFSGVIFASVGRAALPYLSRQVATNDMKAFKETLRFYMWAVGIGTTILSILMIMLAHPIVHILFQRGAFSADDTNHTATTLIGFLVGLTPMSFAFIAFRVFSALGKTRVLMSVSIFSVTANAVFDFIFAHFWQGQGIALATSAVYFCTMCMYYYMLRRIVGPLNFLVPPSEFTKAIKLIGIDRYHLRWLSWKEAHFSYNLHQILVRMGVITSIFAAGIAGIIFNSLYTLRIALASTILLALLRYRYALLIAWAIIDGANAWIIFRGTNVLIGLTIPTLLLMFYLPIKQTLKRMPALIFLLIYLLWVFASIGISATGIGVGTFLTVWVQQLDCLMVSILLINVLTTQQRIMKLIDATLLLSTFISIYGIYGYFTKQNGGMDPTTSLFRIYSIFGAPPGLALFLSVIIPLALYRSFIWQGFKRGIGLLLVLLFLITIVLTFTRSALISVPLSIIIMIFFIPSHKIKLGMFAGICGLIVAALLISTLGNVHIFDRFFNQDVTTLNGRTYLWQALLDHFDPKQLLGNGLQASTLLLTNLHIGINGQGLIATAPSNLFIGILYDHGIIGLALLLLLIIVLFANLFKQVRKAKGHHRLLFAAAIAVLVSVLLQSFDADDFWDQAISIYIWFAMALPFALCWSSKEQPNQVDEEICDKATEPRIRVLHQVAREPAFRV